VSIDLLEPAAEALADLRDSVVFLGGATIALWLTDPAARAPRVTYDVDVIAVEVTTLTAYASFQERLRALRFNEDVQSGVMGRWKHAERGIVLDAVPVKAELAGFSGRWLAAAVQDPAEVPLPSGTVVRAVRPPWLIATKIEAFLGRGRSDCLTSRDFEDIVTLVDGREELLHEIQALPGAARRYVSEQISAMTQLPTFAYGVEGALPGGDAGRAEFVTVPRLAAIASL
jgi:hypothetical protein